MIRVCAVIPVYNHPQTIATVVGKLRDLGLPCVLVDDGCNAECAAVLDQLALTEGVLLERHAVNAGKGAAVTTGLRAASAQGYTHALQIDADGQHDASAVPHLLEQAQAHPQAVITGYPQFDQSVPRLRFLARYLTHVWVWINTLSLRIRDSMCGFRVYPLGATIKLLDQMRIGSRMDFDTEILVRLDWADVQIVNLPVKVSYPADGISHFQGLRDNVLISKMHARLFFGMLWRAPRLLARHFRRTR